MLRTVRTQVQPTSAAIMGIARDAACAVADVAIAAMTEGRWADTPHRAQAYQLSVQVLALEAELGPVCDATFAQRHISAMANAAHLVVQHARLDADNGNACLSRTADWQLTDGCMDDALVPAYALVVLPLAA